VCHRPIAAAAMTYKPINGFETKFVVAENGNSEINIKITSEGHTTSARSFDRDALDNIIARLVATRNLMDISSQHLDAKEPSHDKKTAK
jgi:hypothetical protein